MNLRDNSLKSLAETQCKLSALEERYMQLQCDAQKFREEGRMAQCQLGLTEKALEEARREIAEQKRTIEALRGDIDIYEGLKERSSAAIAGLQSSHREALRNVAHLEAQVRNMKDKLNESPQRESVLVEKMKRNAADLTTRLGLPERAKTDLDFLFSEITERLDRLALREVRHNESSSVMRDAKAQLAEARCSATDLAARVEGLLKEKEALKKRISLLEAENADLGAAGGLLKQRIEAQERQICGMRLQLAEMAQKAEKAHSEREESAFERRTQAVQFTSLLESLAASLSTLESPCAPSESGVKEAVTRLTADLRHLRKVGAELNNRASELQRQFEAQFNSGLTLSEELKEVLRQLDTERQEKKRMQAELDGYRLLRSASSAQVTDCLLSVSDRLRLQGGRPNCTAEELAERIRCKVDELVACGCLQNDCLTALERTYQNELETLDASRSQAKGQTNNHPHHHHHLQGSASARTSPVRETIAVCPSCEEMRVSAYDIARNAPSWSKSDEIIIQNLCVCCLQSLSLGLRSRLERAMADVEELRIELATQLSQGDRTERQRIASRESELLAELEGAKKEIEMLHRRMEQIEDEKDSEAEHLEKLTNKLEKLRQQQARKIAGLQTKTEQQKLAGQHQEKLLTAAKGAIAGVRQKQIRLLDFRNTLARMLSIDTWTIPNPESIIVQKVQALLCSTQMAAQRQFSQQWMVNPVNRISALIPQSPMRLPALDYSELQSAPFENTFTETQPARLFPNVGHRSSVGRSAAGDLRRAPSVADVTELTSQVPTKPTTRTQNGRRQSSRSKSASAVGRDTRKY